MKWNRNLPIGTRDKLFKEAASAYDMEHQVNRSFHARGYQRIETPVIEFDDVFSAINDMNLYRFFDKKGRLTVLRPDMTSPIGRVISTTGVTPPLKLCYSGKVFRANEELAGERNEMTQAGIEIIGFASIKAEIECITSAIGVLKQLGITDFQIEIGHAAIYQAIVQTLGLQENDEEAFRQALQNKSLFGIRSFVASHPSAMDAFILALPRLFGSVDTIQEARDLTDNVVILEALAQMETIVQVVDAPEHLSVDIGLVQELHYYTGAIFRGYADMSAVHFLSGGRYDSLFAQFGEDNWPAVGLALNLDEIVSLKRRTLKNKNADAKVFIHYSLETTQLAEEVLAQTPNASLSFFDELSESIAYAEKWQFSKLIDVSNNTILELEVTS
ncbi:ATP phosphoribosyltransferase regulatory subunit [Listeria booriae]|uniref:ATP phosphoribosyltransferase regulatory subunit n=1 Tax=Listeria booriae TaxID=1552123 RepID=A0A7X1DQ09_9LIST|nr:ATP phosphoribosyltransferase regulatory subunit [Listeria booriae]MBC1779763.1 ATP phosphoribosyltransferase regulatory subunit [Listeria booriae]MBC1805031.1 ATP phosphoribosyltransferase regulatory subunit [Listeria booriae]MBC1887790.1 ATP phosphoribosyltransferase regulatory subunit [Listeria booriae]MBC1898170.1 ATP phosphoribosyltransferase regulatory subunit [Listeria booriae]MBC2172214.1 ATP phosphoribosyltransferase regulatory subunit [Listeria booriae]